jgi:hypothetical protein
VGFSLTWERVSDCSSAKNQAYDEEHNEDEKKDARDITRGSRDSAETQDSSDNRDNQEYHCPVKHESSP